MQLNNLAAVGDIGDVNGNPLAINGDAATFRSRGAESDAQKIRCRGIGAPDHDSLMGVPDIDILPACKNG